MIGSSPTCILAHTGSEDAEFQFKHARSEDAEVVPFHHHFAYELFYFLSGDVNYSVEHQTYRLQPYDLVILNTNELHAAQPISSKPYERIVIHFTPRYLRGFESLAYNILGFLRASRLGVGNYVSGAEGNTAEFYDIVQRIEEYVADPRPESSVMIRTLFVQTLVCVNRYFEERRGTSFRSSMDTEDRQYDDKIARILGYLEDNLTGDLSLSFLEKEFGVSRHYMCRLFKRNTGYTIHEYITNKRIMHAVEMLNEGATALEACDTAGFGDYSNFYKAFQRVTGLTPHQFSSGKS